MTHKTMVYRYGLRWPSNADDERAVYDEMIAGHRYHNDLIAIERGRRAAMRLHCEAPPELTEAARQADADVARLASEIKHTRAQSRTRSDTQAMRDALALARLEKKRAVDAVRAARQRDPAKADEINLRARELAKHAYALYPDLGSGTRAVVDEAVNLTVQKMALFDGLEPNDPRFCRWAGEGTIGVQVNQKGDGGEGYAGDEIRSNDWAALVPVSDTKRATYGEWRMRIGKGEAQRLVAWPVKIHRPLPAGSVVRRATVSLRKIGPRRVWSVSITVRVPQEEQTRRSGVVGIDVGWRQIGDEIRVAYWAGDDGASGELRIPAALIGGLRKADELRGVRDENLDRMRAALVDRWPACARWKSPERFVRLSRQHPEWEDLAAWRYHDQHLWAWESSQRAKSLGRRRDLYRCFARMLADRYGTVVLERFDLRRVAKRGVVEAAAENETARGNRQLAAVSELRGAIENAAHVVLVDGADTTRTCRACGLVTERDSAGDVTIVCECGAVWDQDEAAAHTIRERWDGDEKEAEQKETKQARIARLKAEKMLRQGTARNAAATAAE